MNKIIVGVESRMTDTDDKWEVLNDYQLINNVSQYVNGLKSALKSGKIPEMSDYPNHYRLAIIRINGSKVNYEYHPISTLIEVK